MQLRYHQTLVELGGEESTIVLPAHWTYSPPS
jgi:hypothetical protein